MVILMGPLFCYFAPDLKNIRTGPGCTLAVAQGGGGGGGGAEQEKRKNKWGKGENEGRRLFIRQWPSLWTTTFGLSMAVIHNAGHWQFFKITNRRCKRRPLTS